MKIGIEWEGKTLWFGWRHWRLMSRTADALAARGTHFRWRFRRG